jgi:hypothetical protein
VIPPQLNLVTETACNSVWFLPLHRDRLLVCNRTNSLYIMSINGDVRVTIGVFVIVVVSILDCMCREYSY